MLQIAICDDESHIVELIANKINIIIEQLTYYNCFQTTQADELIQFAINTHIDILLIDIEMPKYSGFEVVEQLLRYNKETLIIFVTNLDMYVYESIKYRPFRFIRKSHLEELEEALISAISVINKSTEKFKIQVNASLNYEVKIIDIVYFESLHNYVRIVTTNGENTYRATLKFIEKELAGKGFIRIYSSILLNLKYVYLINIKKSIVEIRYCESSAVLPVSRNYQKNLIAEYKTSLR